MNEQRTTDTEQRTVDPLAHFTAIGARMNCGADQLRRRFDGVRALLFDWDGVFNNGFKDAAGGSPFSEVDSMGVNLLRFALWLKNSSDLPKAGIITGQHNAFAEIFATRERLHAVFMGYTNKPEAFDAFLASNDLRPEQVAYFYDDVLDLPVAARCGLRVLIGRKASPWFDQQAKPVTDVITGHDGGHHGLREACELLIALSGEGGRVIEHRTRFSQVYQEYLAARDAVQLKVERQQR